MDVITPFTLVLLPGMHGAGNLFAPFVRKTSDSIKLVAVSYPADQPLDYQGHLDIVMSALPEDEPFVLLGESFSGPLALMTAAQRPKGLRGVILCATFVTWPLPISTLLARLMVVLGGFRLKSTQLFLRIVLGNNAPDWLKTLFSETLTNTRPEVLAARAKAVMDLDCTEELSKCPVPVLVMTAERDRLLSERSQKLIRSIRPDAEYVEIDSPHLILQCAPVQAAAEITRFSLKCF